MEGIQQLEKPYAVVEFEDGVQLIAAKWMIGDKKCYWPNFTSNIRYDTAVKFLEDPDGSWKTYDLLNVVATADTFEKGKQKLKEAETFSDVNSGYDTETKKRNRRERAAKKKLRLETSMFGNDEEGSSSDDEQWTKKPSTTKNKAKKSLPPCPTPPSFSSFSKSPSNVLPSQTYQTTSVTSTPCVSTTILPFQSNSNNNTPRRQSPKKSTQKVEKEDFQRYVKKTLADLKYKVNALLSTQHEILEELQSHRQKSTAPTDNGADTDKENYLPYLENNLPLDSKDSLAAFEAKLEEDKKFNKFVITELKKMGGNNVKSAVILLMTKLLSNSVAQNYSWIGGKGKLIFSTLNLCKVIMETVRLHFEVATDTEIASFIKNWLRHAKERDERIRKKDVEEVGNQEENQI